MCRNKIKLFSLAATAALFLPHFAGAQDDVDSSSEPVISVAAQPLAGALKEFSDQTGLQIAYVATLADNKVSNGVENAATPIDALDGILESTGLEFQFVNEETVAIGATKGERGDSDSKNLSQAPILMAQNRSNQTSNRASPRSDVSATSIITGKVTDARSGANIKGAMVTIVETGHTTKTDDLGSFRFVNVPLGTQTLNFSYLGIASSAATIEVVAGDSNNLSIALSEAIEEIVVIGQRSARAQSLNLQRTAPNNTEVVSADLIGNFTGTTVSEALRRVPGITFQQSGLTGEGTNIMIRGLEPDLNTVTLNGLRLPDNSGRGRSGDLSNILADSISKITVNKSLLPSHDSSGTGGLVEIETKSPLDRPRRFFNVSIEGGETGKDFSDDLLASTTASGSFGQNDQFGLSASFQYRDRGIQSVTQSQEFQYGQYLPAEADASVFVADPTAMIDPRRLFPFEDGGSTVYPVSQVINSLATETSNKTLGLAAEWQVNSGTNLRVDVIRIDAERETLNSAGGDFYFSLYMPTSIQALDGEVRQALSYFNAVNTSRSLLGSQFKDNTNTVSLRGETDIGNWRFEYGGGYAKGSQDFASQSISTGGFLFHDPAFVQAEATDSIEGRVLSIFAPVTGGIQQPLLTQAGFDFFNDPAQHALQRSGTNSVASSNERRSGELSGRYSFASEKIRYIEAGIFYEEADFDSEIRPGISTFDQFLGSGATAADVGLGINNSVWHRIGAVPGAGTLSSDNIGEVFSRMRALDGAGVTVLSFDVDPRLAGEMTREEELSGYFETELNFGRLAVIGGVRVAQVKTTATKLQRPSLRLADGTFDTAFEEANTEIVNFDDTVTDVLPRVLANYRQSDNVVFRGGYFLTIARPTIRSLSSAPNISLSLYPFGGPQFNQTTLFVSQGNPGLKPAVTHNFDLGAEFYSDNVGVIKVGVFYKRIENFIDSTANSSSRALDGITLPNDPRFQNLPSDIFISVSRPINAEGTAEIWGAEVVVEHRFANLSGMFDGLGIYGNYTFSDSSREATQSWFSSPVFDVNGVLIGREQLDYVREAPFDQQSRHSGTAAFTYERDSFDAALSYSFQDRRLVKFGDGNAIRDRFGFDTYADQIESLDFRAEYRLSSDNGGRYRLWLEAQDILDSTSDPITESVGGANGVQELTARRNYLGGRSFKIGVSATF